MDFDFHTHRLDTPPGTGIVSLPQDIVRNPKVWTTYPSAQQFHPQGLYAAGIHPWWTLDKDFDLEEYKAGLSQLWDLPQVVQIGECGFDRLRGASLEVQWAVFSAQVADSERRELPMILHIVRAFDLILQARKTLRPQQVWTIHGFRGKPALAQQLLKAGFHLSFGKHYNENSFLLTPPQHRHLETDAQP